MDVPGQPVPDERDTTPDFIISASELDRYLTEIERVQFPRAVRVVVGIAFNELRTRLGLPNA